MEDFLFEEELMESMEVLSFEERDIDEVVRENAHALLDAEMDMEELLCESSIEVLTEGTMADIGRKIKEMWAKLKALIKKFIDWIRSLIKKESSTTSKKSSGYQKQKEDDVKIPDAPSKGDIRLFNAKGAIAVIRERMGKASAVLENDFDVKEAMDELNNIKELCFKDLEKLWYNGNISEVIEERNGTIYYHNVNSDFEDILKALHAEIEEVEAMTKMDPNQHGDPERFKRAIPVVKLLISVSQAILAELQKIFKEDKANRMAAIRADMKANGNRRGV